MFLEAVWSLWKRWEDSHSTKTTFMLCALQQSGVFFFSLFLMELIHKHPFVLQLSNENKVKRTSVIFDCAGPDIADSLDRRAAGAWIRAELDHITVIPKRIGVNDTHR